MNHPSISLFIVVELIIFLCSFLLLCLLKCHCCILLLALSFLVERSVSSSLGAVCSPKMYKYKKLCFSCVLWNLMFALSFFPEPLAFSSAVTLSETSFSFQLCVFCLRQPYITDEITIATHNVTIYNLNNSLWCKIYKYSTYISLAITLKKTHLYLDLATKH